MQERPSWSKKNVSSTKDLKVSNAFRSDKCVVMGVDRYVVTDAFRVTKWYSTRVKPGGIYKEK